MKSFSRKSAMTALAIASLTSSTFAQVAFASAEDDDTPQVNKVSGIRVAQLFINAKSAEGFHVSVYGRQVAELAKRIERDKASDDKYTPNYRRFTVYSPSSGLEISCFTDAGLPRCSFWADENVGYLNYGEQSGGKLDLSFNYDYTKGAPTSNKPVKNVIEVKELDPAGERDSDTLPGDVVRMVGDEASKLYKILPAWSADAAKSVHGFKFVKGNHALTLQCTTPTAGPVECLLSYR